MHVAEETLAGEAARALESPEAWENPYPFYARLRQRAPVHLDDRSEMYLVSRYRDCRHLLTNPALRTQDHGWHDQVMPDWRDHPAAVWAFTSLPYEERRNHARIRTLVNRAFTRRRVEQSLLPMIRRVVDDLFDALGERGAGGAIVDLQDAVGFRLPVTVIAGLVGVPDGDLPRFRWVFGEMLRVMDFGVDEDTLARADAAALEVRDYFAGLLRERRAKPADDLASALVGARDDGGDRLSEEELLSLVILLFTAGFETTTLTIGTGTHALLGHPDQRDLLRADPSLAAAAAREVLRWDCVVQRVSRVTDGDIEVGQTAIPAGSVVGLLLGAANRDPLAYVEPDRFDMRRRGPRPLTFGGGPWVCLGSALAEVELEVYFAELTRRFPGLEPAGEPERRRGWYLRGLDTLPVTLGGP